MRPLAAVPVALLLLTFPSTLADHDEGAPPPVADALVTPLGAAVAWRVVATGPAAADVEIDGPRHAKAIWYGDDGLVLGHSFSGLDARASAGVAGIGLRAYTESADWGGTPLRLAAGEHTIVAAAGGDAVVGVLSWTLRLDANATLVERIVGTSAFADDEDFRGDGVVLQAPGVGARSLRDATFDVTTRGATYAAFYGRATVLELEADGPGALDSWWCARRDCALHEGSDLPAGAYRFRIVRAEGQADAPLFALVADIPR